jgi:hypothetical protein
MSRLVNSALIIRVAENATITLAVTAFLAVIAVASSDAPRTLERAEMSQLVAGWDNLHEDKDCAHLDRCSPTLAPCTTQSQASCGENSEDAEDNSVNRNDCIKDAPGKNCTEGGSNTCLWRYPCYWSDSLGMCIANHGLGQSLATSPARCKV